MGDVLGAEPAGPPGPALGADARGAGAADRGRGGAALGRGEPGLPGAGTHAPPGRSRHGRLRSGRRDLGGAPVWVGYLADKIIAATETRLVALEPGQGAARVAVRPRHPGRRPPRRQPVRPGRAGPTPSATPARRGSMTSGSSGAGSSASAATGADGLRRRHGTGRLVVLAARRHDQPAPLDRPAADRAPGPQAGRDPGPRDRRPAAAAPSSPGRGRGVGPRPRCRSTTTTSRSCPTAGRSRSSTSAAGSTPGSSARAAELPKHGPPRLLGDAERLLVLHDGNDADPARPGDRQEARWSRPLGIEDLSERPEATVLDGERVLLGQRPDASRARGPGRRVARSGRGT